MTLTLPSFERIAETMSEGLWVIDENSLTTYLNPCMAGMLGYPREEVLGRPLFDFMTDEGRRVAEQNVQRRKEGLAEAHDFVFRRKNGDALPATVHTNPLLGPNGEYLGAYALITDLTELRRKEQERERFWRILDESVNEIYIFRGESLRFEYASRAALMNLGYTLEELRGMSPADIKPTHTLASLRALFGGLTPGGAKVVFLATHRRRDGSTYPVEVHVHRTASAELEYVAVINDITTRLEAERTLRASEARHRALIESTSDLLFLAGPDGRFTFASPSVTRVLGYAPEEFLARSPFDLIHPEDRGVATEAFASVAGQVEGARVTFRVLHKDGNWRTLQSSAQNLLDNPDVRAVVLNSRDVTSERKLEEQLQQSQRLESVGRLAGGVAHDFNNILTTILGCATFLSEDPSLSEGARADAREITAAGRRASELTNQLLAFARRRVIRPETVAIGEILSNQERFLRRVLGEQIVLRTDIAADLWPVRLDPAQLEQVIVNLAVNARDAMKDGGKLVFEARNVMLDEAFLSVHADIQPGPFVLLSVSDSGHGIPAEVLPHIFEPFFTTKPVGVGSGLGLATVYGIVRQSQGYIWVYSEPGVGTTFKIYFPRSELSLPSPEPPPAPRTDHGTERILVVEDEESVRRMLVRALESAGYRVHSEPTPSAALAWANAQGGAFDLLITDVVMPEMSGKQLAESVTASFPRVRVLFISGYTENTIVHRGVLDEGVDFVAKPFSLPELRAKLREILER